MKALLVALDYKKEDFDYSIEELKELCKACNIEVSKIITQEIIPLKATYVGSGKLIEIKNIILDEDVVIFNEELTPMQNRNITNVLDIPIMDRSDLILTIFESRAKTKEAILQVEMARLKYELPRLAHAHQEIYSQQGGSGFRGAGEKKIELERRNIHHRLTKASKELKKVKKERQTQRKKRGSMKKVSLVGYTNAGKSSLLNLLTHKKVFSEDMLFATLETSSRKVRLKDNKDIILNDTVGFISGLPHHLIEAFKSTLEEVKEADLIVHVVDISNKHHLMQIETTNKVLEEIGVKDTPILYVYNKCDIKHDTLMLENPHVIISCKDNINIDLLKDEMIKQLFKDEERLTLFIPYDKGEIYNILKYETLIINEQFNDEGITLTIEASTYYKNKYKEYISEDNYEY